VRHFNQGCVPSYSHSYHLAHELLGEEDERQLVIRCNRINCKDVLTAMSPVPVKQDSRGKIAKAKSSEKKLTVLGQEATHFTDTVDLHFLSINKYVARTTPHAGGLLIVSA
jgi:hypothetical protein